MRKQTPILAVALTVLLVAPSVAAEDGPPPTTKAAAATSGPSGDYKVGYKGGFFIASPDGLYKLKIGARVQARFTFTSDDSDESYAFSIPRARLALKGNVFSKALKYKFQADFGKGSAALKDFYADYQVIKNWLHIRAGQFKKPFSRQQMTSSSKLGLVDRAITDKASGAGRDIGLMLHNKANTFEWALGAFNGTGDKGRLRASANASGTVSGKFTNVPDKFNPMVVLRVGYNHNKIKGYSESDLEGGDLRFAVAAAVKIDGGLDTVGDKGTLGSEVDFALKVSGFSATGALYLNLPLGGGGLDTLGAHVQLGQVFAERYAVLLRYARVEGLLTGGTTTQEIGGGFTVFVFGHKMKWQTDFAALLEETAPAASETTFQVRTQIQLGF